jgi:cell division protein ZapA (FtsZ GTPase activity inhibitor)
VKLVSVRIFDQDYHIKSDASGETILQIAAYINEQIERMRSSAFAGTRTDLAVMVALKAASDYFQAREDLSRLKKRIEAEAAALAAKIEGGLPGRSAPHTSATTITPHQG